MDITFLLPNGLIHRERKKAPVASKSGAQRWGQDRERHLLLHGLPEPQKEVPTLIEFAPRFVEEHARANRQKPSAIAATESILKWHLVPALGGNRLDLIASQDVQRLKRLLQNKAPKTVNNVLTVLSTLLKKAVEWGELERMPCTIKLLANPRKEMQFFDFEEYERLLVGTQTRSMDTHLMALLGGEAGLRLGELVAIEWRDVDLQERQLTVERSDWCGHIGVPKGGRSRRIPLTPRVATALKAFRHLRSPRVFCLAGGGPTTRDRVIKALRREERLAGLTKSGVHILRHTFCSHLAMRGATASAIQKLAGHADLSTTQRYMHLSPAAIEDAMRLLDRRFVGVESNNVGEMLEKGLALSGNI